MGNFGLKIFPIIGLTVQGGLTFPCPQFLVFFKFYKPVLVHFCHFSFVYNSFCSLVYMLD